MTLREVERLIEEGAHEMPRLEFKAGAALGRGSAQQNELVKDVSRMANAAGSRNIYGVAEVTRDGVTIASALVPVQDVRIRRLPQREPLSRSAKARP